MNDNNKLTPKIRFKGFTDVWEQRKLGDCFTERVESMPDGELISVTINDGIKKFSELGRHDNSNEDKSKYKKVCVGDIAYNSMRMWQGASGYSPYEGIVSPAYTVLSPNSGINSKCLAYQFKLPDMIHTFQINSQGITSDNWNLKYPALSEIEVFISKDEQEQAKIAEYFENLDRLITLHQRKYDKLVNMKKSMLEKMFPKNPSNPPEIRFKGFTDVWEQRKVTDIGENFNTSTLGYADLCRNGKYKCVLYGELYTRYNERIFNVNSRTNTEATEVKRNDILFPTSTTVDAISLISPSCVNEDNIRVGGDLFGIRPYQNIDGNFISYCINNFNPVKYSFAKQAQGLTIVHLQYNAIKNEKIKIPSLKEQNKMSDLFIQIDNLITLHQRKLAKLQNIKKSLLEKMFV